jgi:hypothetical protein
MPPGRKPGPANEAGSTGHGECDGNRVHASGRSWVIHMLWNGFLFVGAASDELAC